MRAIPVILILQLTLCISSAGVLYRNESRLEIRDKKVLRIVTEHIEVPDEEMKAMPPYQMGKGSIPVTMDEVIRIANEYFQKTLGVPFKEENGFIDIQLRKSTYGSTRVWWYHVRFDLITAPKFPSMAKDLYQLGIPMNGKAYAALTTSKEVADTSDPIQESGIPFLQTGQRTGLHILESEMVRLGKAPVLESAEVPGVYLHKDGTSAYIFYPDGTLFAVHTIAKLVYKVNDRGMVTTNYEYGEAKNKLSYDQYIGVIGHGTFVRDHGDYTQVYHLRDQRTTSTQGAEALRPPK